MTNILFLAPYESCIEDINQVISERKEEKIIYDVVLDQFDNKLESITADVVISRGFTAQTMKNIDIPSAEIKTSGYDIIAAINRCLKLYKKKNIFLLGALNIVYDYEDISKLYPGISLTARYVTQESNLEQCVLDAINDGAEAIVGGCSTVALAEKHNMPAVLIESGKKALNIAIDDALSTLQVYRREKRKSTEISNIMNYSFQGIISTNVNGEITLANKQCYSIINDISQPLIGCNVKNLFQTIPFDDVLKDEAKILSEIQSYDFFI